MKVLLVCEKSCINKAWGQFRKQNLTGGLLYYSVLYDRSLHQHWWHVRYTAISKKVAPVICDAWCMVHVSLTAVPYGRFLLWGGISSREYVIGSLSNVDGDAEDDAQWIYILQAYFKLNVLPCIMHAGYETWIIHHGSQEQPFMK